MQGNEACAEGAIAAGCRFFAGYPITPASEIAEQLSVRIPQVDGTFIQMEDEIARVQKKLGNSDFVAKAKEEVIQKERDKAVQFDEKLRTLRSSLAKIEDLQAGRN